MGRAQGTLLRSNSTRQIVGFGTAARMHPRRDFLKGKVRNSFVNQKVVCVSSEVLPVSNFHQNQGDSLYIKIGFCFFLHSLFLGTVGHVLSRCAQYTFEITRVV